MILELENTSTGYANKQVLYKVSLSINTGETVLLVGPNGSGKTTLLHLIIRMLTLWHSTSQNSSMRFQGKSIESCRAEEMIHQGMMLLPQKGELFNDFTVEKNLKSSILWMENQAKAPDRLQIVYSQIPLLQKISHEKASNLSGGERRLTSFGMALMNSPRLLLLDEPLAGVSPSNSHLILDALKLFRNLGTSIVIVEHRVREVFSLADRTLGMKAGQLLVEPLKSIQEIKGFML